MALTATCPAQVRYSCSKHHCILTILPTQHGKGLESGGTMECQDMDHALRGLAKKTGIQDGNTCPSNSPFTFCAWYREYPWGPPASYFQLVWPVGSLAGSRGEERAWGISSPLPPCFNQASSPWHQTSLPPVPPSPSPFPLAQVQQRLLAVTST